MFIILHGALIHWSFLVQNIKIPTSQLVSEIKSMIILLYFAQQVHTCLNLRPQLLIPISFQQPRLRMSRSPKVVLLSPRLLVDPLHMPGATNLYHTRPHMNDEYP